MRQGRPFNDSWKGHSMIATAVLAIFVLEMGTLAAALWSLRALTARGHQPETGSSREGRS
jgi:hypothetical protein